MRRNPGQAVNLAHLIWRRPCAPAPLPFYKGKSQIPGGFFLAGLLVIQLGLVTPEGEAESQVLCRKLTKVPALHLGLLPHRAREFWIGH